MANRLDLLNTRKALLALVIASFCFLNASGETKWKVSTGAELVSSYVWRGVYQTGVSFQPALTVSYADGLSLSAWGSTDFSTVGQADLGIAKEVDFTLGYSVAGFSIAATDYWWAGEGTRYGHHKAAHFIEATLGYATDRFGISWNTMLQEGNGGDSDYKQLYSTYIQGDLNFDVSGVACTLSAGISPWTGIYHREGTTDFALNVISLTATKEVKISEDFSLPVFARITSAPNQDNLFFVFGLRF
jgi:hypothetical protein